MTVDANNVVSTTETSQDFSKAASIVDQHGRADALKDDAMRHLVTQSADTGEPEYAAEEEVLASAARMMDLYDDAFKELAK